MTSLLLCVIDNLTKVIEPVFEARTIDVVRRDIRAVCEKSARKPSEFTILQLGTIKREDIEEKTGRFKMTKDGGKVEEVIVKPSVVYESCDVVEWEVEDEPCV